MQEKFGAKGKMSRGARIQKLLRSAKTAAENKFSISGKLKTGHDAPKPITLRKLPRTT